MWTWIKRLIWLTAFAAATFLWTVLLEHGWRWQEIVDGSRQNAQILLSYLGLKS